VKPRTLEQAKREEELVEKAKKGLLVEPPSKQAPAKSAAARAFNVFVDGEYFQVEVDAGGDGQARVASPAPTTAPAVAPAAAPAVAPAAAKPAAAPTSAPPSVAAANGAIVAPMPGLVVEYRVKSGDVVAVGDVVCILEAMKMQNEISADRAGKIASLGTAPGAEVDRGDVLVVIDAD
jgi:biotin carboxyl carrier protein